ncbi:hypothetical protein CPAV1605_428 [seawater metagenome]|uniref:Uncharacterized protein n=1 Tax=seawater metagenome TaxID=1561972 RepID=A0A5E8CH26_9ZZZZ
MNKKNNSNNINNNQLLKELLQKQRKDVPDDKKLYLHDIKRICKNINTSIFSDDGCCIWNGYITNLNKANKGTYINFYFRQKKVALHRLLFLNYVDGLSSDEYLKFSCENKGICCNVNHLKKFKYNKAPKKVSTEKKPKKKNQVNIIYENSCNKNDENELVVDFS